MKVFICLDEKNGMMFNKRRQSKDLKVIEKIKEIVSDSTLTVLKYSSSLFGDAIVCNDFTNAKNYVFIEDPDFLIPDKIEELFIFKWNRHYPSDKKLSINLSDYTLVHSEDFEGNSHEKITLEKYIRSC